MDCLIASVFTLVSLSIWLCMRNTLTIHGLLQRKADSGPEDVEHPVVAGREE